MLTHIDCDCCYPFWRVYGWVWFLFVACELPDAYEWVFSTGIRNSKEPRELDGGEGRSATYAPSFEKARQVLPGWWAVFVIWLSAMAWVGWRCRQTRLSLRLCIGVGHGVTVIVTRFTLNLSVSLGNVDRVHSLYDIFSLSNAAGYNIHVYVFFIENTRVITCISERVFGIVACWPDIGM